MGAAMEISLSGRSVFLTGGSRGIGKRIGEVFQAAGAELTAPGREELDLLSAGSIEEYIRSHQEVKPDIFIHCAGINRLAGITEIDRDILQDVFQVNLYSAVQLLNAFADSMKEKKYGRILFVSSLYAMVSKERRIAYSASKNALTGLAKTLALELAPYHVMVNLIAPGYVMTDMTRKNLSEQEIELIREQIPTGSFQSEDDIASLAAFLCSDYNRSITGQLIAVDGGFTCR